MSILAASTAISAAAAATSQFNKITNAVATAGKAIGSGVDFTQRLSGQASLTDVARLTRAEFFTVVDNDCLNVDFLPDVMQSALSIAIGYYLQATPVQLNFRFPLTSHTPVFTYPMQDSIDTWATCVFCGVGLI